MTDNVIHLSPSMAQPEEFMQYCCDICGSRAFKITIKNSTKKTRIECANCETWMALDIVEID